MRRNLARFFEEDGKIMATKPERVAQGDIRLALLCLIERQAAPGIEVWIGVEVVTGRRYDVFIYRHQTGDTLDRASRTQKMAGHRLSGADAHFVRVVAKHFLNRSEERRVGKDGR